MWRRYFKLVKLVPGKVIVQGHGTIDFAGNVSVELCQKLYEEDFEFLQITEEGKQLLYGIGTPIKNEKLEIQNLEKQPVEKVKRSYKRKV